MSRTPADIESLDRAECLRLLGSRTVGRLAFVVGDQPVVLPVNYALDAETVVLRTGLGEKLQNAPLRRVAFEVDDVSAAPREGWSVLVKGVAQHVTSSLDEPSVRLRTADVRPMAPNTDHWVRIVPRQITGRRVHPSAPS
ncbi:MAG: hypothetical protein JWP02_1860 [Acidimicrobiales bacterium]|nr:hypothetical protein [Acidimicrobiales bacterium]